MTDVPRLYDYTQLYEPKDTRQHLGALLTAQGARSLYDSVCQCNRCGFCAQVCPTFRLTGREEQSGRGRNQLLRMLMNGRLRVSESRREIGALLNDCLMCGACERACFTALRTPLHVWEGVYSLGIKRYPGWLKNVFVSLARDRGALRRKMPFYNLLRLARLWVPSAAVPPAAVFGEPRFRLGASEEESVSPDKAACLYFASCSEQYLSPETGDAARRLLRVFAGPVHALDAGCCGFYAFMAGDIVAARAALAGVIDKYEEACAGRKIPLVCACADCAGFFRQAEQLFSEDEAMRPRAARFASAVREVIDYMAPEFFEPRAENGVGVPVITGHFPAGFGRSAASAARTDGLLAAVFGADYHRHEESDMPCGAYGAYPFVNADMANRLLRRKAANIAAVQATLAVTATIAEAAWLGAGLKRYCNGAGTAHYCVVLYGCVKEKFHADKI